MKDPIGQRASRICEHALFDPDSAYSRMRAGFRQGEKLRGYSFWLQCRKETAMRQLREEPARAPTEPATAPTGTNRSPEAAPRESRRPLVLRVFRSAGAARGVAPPIGRLVDAGEVQAGKEEGDSCGQLVLGWRDLPVRDSACRLFLVETSVAERLRRARPERRPGDNELAAFFTDEILRANLEVARVLSAVPDLDGVVDDSGSVEFVVDIPGADMDLGDSTCLILVLGPPVRELVPSSVSGKFCAFAAKNKQALTTAALLLLAVFSSLGFAAKAVQWYQAYSELRRELHLDSPVVFFDERELPAHPTEVRPLSCFGREIRVRGDAWGHLIRAIRVTVTPGLEGEEPVSEITQAIGGDPNEVESVPRPFRLDFKAPPDGKMRQFTIQCIPHPEAGPAVATLPESGYKVNVACWPTGPVAYVPDKPLLIEGLAEGQMITEPLVAVTGEALEDGYVAVIVRDPDNSLWLHTPEPIAVRAGRFGPIKVHFGMPTTETGSFVVHFAFCRSVDAWPAELRTWNSAQPLPSRLPQAATPGDEITYVDIKVKVRL